MQAHVRALGAHSLHELQIRLGHLFGLIVRMAYLIAAQFTFTADLTSACHSEILHESEIRKIRPHLTIRALSVQAKNAESAGTS